MVSGVDNQTIELFWHTDSELKIKAPKVPAFKAGAKLKAAVNGAKK